LNLKVLELTQQKGVRVYRHTRREGKIMKALYFAALLAAAGAPTETLAQTPQVAPVRVEFTRPGGTPGAARAMVRPSEVYMMAPAQPDTAAAPKRRKQR
jgi:hypothetical protein